jgi:hypothetical protein
LGVVKKHYLNGTGFLRYLNFDFHETSLRLESFLQEKLYRLVDLHPTSVCGGQVLISVQLLSGADKKVSVNPTLHDQALDVFTPTQPTGVNLK